MQINAIAATQRICLHSTLLVVLLSLKMKNIFGSTWSGWLKSIRNTLGLCIELGSLIWKIKCINKQNKLSVSVIRSIRNMLILTLTWHRQGWLQRNTNYAFKLWIRLKNWYLHPNKGKHFITTLELPITWTTTEFPHNQVSKKVCYLDRLKITKLGKERQTLSPMKVREKLHSRSISNVFIKTNTIHVF